MLQEQYAASFDNRRNQKKIFRLIAMKRKECKTAMEKEYHKIMDQAVLSTILIPLFVLAVHYVLSFIIVLVPTVIMAVVYGDGSYEIIHILGRIIEPVILLIVTELIYTRIWFKGEFEGTLKGNIRYGFLLMIPAFLFEILLIILLFIYCKFDITGGVDILSVLSASFPTGFAAQSPSTALSARFATTMAALMPCLRPLTANTTCFPWRWTAGTAASSLSYRVRRFSLPPLLSAETRCSSCPQELCTIPWKATASAEKSFIPIPFLWELTRSSSTTALPTR